MGFLLSCIFLSVLIRYTFYSEQDRMLIDYITVVVVTIVLVCVISIVT